MKIVVFNVNANRGLKFDDIVQFNEFAQDVYHLVGVNIRNNDEYFVEEFNSTSEKKEGTNWKT
jgi:hypothetical protein|tara:strand:+ start:821 stop:1009 length:189 start_codon:yes stop_codon:yes gene_type:complete